MSFYMFAGGEQQAKKKRRRADLDEVLLSVPLEQGWKRETRIKELNKRGISGEVTYFAPSGRRFKAYQDLDKYLEKHPEIELQREHFTFCTNIRVGSFFELKTDTNVSVAS